MQTHKACGDCTLCCKVLMIPALNKPKDRLCTHCTAGCTIYDHRPAVCRDFQCLWTRDHGMGPEWQPSVSGLVIVAESEMRMAIHVDPDRPGAWKREPYFSVLRNLAAIGLERGGFIFVMERGLTTVLLPNQQIAVGDVGPEARILLRERATRGLFDAEVVSPERADVLAKQPGWNLVR